MMDCNNKRLYIGDAPWDNILEVTEELPPYCPKIEPIFSADTEQSFEFTGYIKPQMFEEALVRDNKPRVYGISYKSIIYIQKRYHKDRRINKKWLKRYGYKPIIITYNLRTDMISVDETGEVTFECGCSNFDYDMPKWIINNKRLAIKHY